MILLLEIAIFAQNRGPGQHRSPAFPVEASSLDSNAYVSKMQAASGFLFQVDKMLTKQFKNNDKAANLKKLSKKKKNLVVVLEELSVLEKNPQNVELNKREQKVIKEILVQRQELVLKWNKLMVAIKKETPGLHRDDKVLEPILLIKDKD